MSLVILEEPTEPPAADMPPVLAYPFRPFFLLAGGYGALLLVAWMAILFAGLPLPLGVAPAQWHAHEMLFGLIPAAVTGFLLTAMCTWTGARPLSGRPLLGLVALWLAGRVGMWASGLLPIGVVAAVDLAFLPTVAIYAGRVLARHGNRRNYGLVGLLTVLSLANLAMHLGFAGVWGGGIVLGETLAFDVMAVVVAVVGGRITPAFTANWLRRQDRDPSVVLRSSALDTAVMAAGLLLVVADLVTALVTALPWVAVAAALAAGSLNGWRLVRWRGWHARTEPLLWILHLGMAGLSLGWLLRGLTPLLDLAPFAWMHALGVAAMGVLIIGVMTRVSLGHTGRLLVLPSGVVWAYRAILAAAGLRLLSALGVVQHRGWLLAAGAAWTFAFALFVVRYAGILTSPRPDGRPG